MAGMIWFLNKLYIKESPSEVQIDINHFFIWAQDLLFVSIYFSEDEKTQTTKKLEKTTLIEIARKQNKRMILNSDLFQFLKCYPKVKLLYNNMLLCLYKPFYDLKAFKEYFYFKQDK